MTPVSGAAPKVTVMMMTSPGFAPYFRQAIESVLMQRTSFEFEVVVGDDNSKDGTREMISEYAERYPGRVRPVFHVERCGNCVRNFAATFPHCRGEYVARLDGDDYYTDPAKLQKQVDLLDAHPELAFCAHWTALFSDDGGILTERYGPAHYRPVYGLDDFLEDGPFLPTSAVMFRRAGLAPLPAWFPKLPHEDLASWLLLCRSGACGFLDEVMSAYRSRPEGFYQGSGELEMWESQVECLTQLRRNFGEVVQGPVYRRGMARLWGALAQERRRSGLRWSALAATFREALCRVGEPARWKDFLRVALFLHLPFLYRVTGFLGRGRKPVPPSKGNSVMHR
ncbi:Glycosyl transferase family 2 [Verrucomicrobium sp. GAS474]|nr:Glycosyl transferase family 2 [Verrucomicrobium sp. GAS474]